MTWAHLYWFAVVITITYGVTGSALFKPFRILLGTRSNWLLGLLYCPVCFGFWAALALAYRYPESDPWRFLYAPCMYSAIYLAVRDTIAPSWLCAPDAESELETIAEARRSRETE